MSDIDDLEGLFDHLNEPDENIEVPGSALDKIVVDGQALSPVEIQQQEGSPVDVTKYFRKIEEVTDDVLSACKKDRSEIQEVIDLMFSEIRTDQEEGRHPSRGYTDNLTKLLEVKASVNMLAVKMMEANAKMLSATKVTSTTINNSNNVVAQGDDYLRKILAEPEIEGEI